MINTKHTFFKHMILIVSFLVFIILLSFIYNNYIDQNNNRFKKIFSNSYDVINVGSSHGKYAFFYDNDDLSGLNLANISQSFYYDFEILKQYKAGIEEGTKVLIPVSLFSFYKSREDSKKFYYNILDKESLIGISSKEYYSNILFSITQSPVNFIKDLIIVVKGRDIYKWPSNINDERKKEVAIGKAESHLGLDSDTDYLDLPDDNINILCEMIRLIENLNAVPILVTTPLSYMYNNQVTEKIFTNRINMNIESVEEILGHKLRYLDYSHNEMFSNNLDMFADSDHMSKSGAKEFTKVISKDLDLIK